MNINKMTNREKSVILARAANIDGLSVRHIPAEYSTSGEPGATIYDMLAYDCVIYRDYGGHGFYDVDLYDSANMTLAWLVLNWAIKQENIKEKLLEWWVVEAGCPSGTAYYPHEGWKLLELSPADAQRAWLDKILELAIESGMVNHESQNSTMV